MVIKNGAHRILSLFFWISCDIAPFFVLQKDGFQLQPLAAQSPWPIPSMPKHRVIRMWQTLGQVKGYLAWPKVASAWNPSKSSTPKAAISSKLPYSLSQIQEPKPDMCASWFTLILVAEPKGFIPPRLKNHWMFLWRTIFLFFKSRKGVLPWWWESTCRRLGILQLL